MHALSFFFYILSVCVYVYVYMYGFLNEMMKKRIERNFALKLKKKKQNYLILLLFKHILSN